jgi:hypothetical protein
LRQLITTHRAIDAATLIDEVLKVGIILAAAKPGGGSGITHWQAGMRAGIVGGRRSRRRRAARWRAATLIVMGQASCVYLFPSIVFFTYVYQSIKYICMYVCICAL